MYDYADLYHFVSTPKQYKAFLKPYTRYNPFPNNGFPISMIGYKVTLYTVFILLLNIKDLIVACVMYM